MASPRRVRLLSDIWKPDDDELRGAFTSTDFYTEPAASAIQNSVSTAPSHTPSAVNSAPFVLSSASAAQISQQYEALPVLPLNQHSVEDDDSAIQAVVYMKDEPAVPQPAQHVESKSVYETENSFFGLQTLAQLSEEYTEGFQSAGPGGLIQQHAVMQFPPSQVVDPLQPVEESVSVPTEENPEPKSVKSPGSQKAQKKKNKKKSGMHCSAQRFLSHCVLLKCHGLLCSVVC